MMNHTIITIGRQFGSGGHEVGNRLEWVIILHLCSVRKWRNH